MPRPVVRLTQGEDRVKIRAGVKMTSTDWMDRESTRIAETKRQVEELNRQQLKAAMTAQQGGPEYWKRFVDEAKIQTGSLEKKFTKPGFIDEKIVGHSVVEEPTATCGTTVAQLSSTDTR